MPQRPYVVAVTVLVTTFFAGLALTPANDRLATAVWAFGWIASVSITFGATFGWGRRCGFSLKDSAGRVSLTNFLRNVAMSAVMFFAVGVVAGGFLAAGLVSKGASV